MKMQAAIRRHLTGTFLALTAIFATSCAMAETPSPNPSTSRPVVLTRITTEAGTCDAAFENNNCGGLGEPGHICVAAGTEEDPNSVKLKFVYSGPGANSGEFESMQIGIDDDGDGDPDDWVCPGDVQDDFPDFNEECVYEHPDSDPDTVMQVDDNNTVERDWVYSITLIPRGGCSSVTLHPPIENGGSSGSSGGDEDEDEDEGDGP